MHSADVQYDFRFWIVFWIALACIWAICMLLSTVIHELGHYLADKFFGGTPQLHHNYVIISTPEGSLRSVLISAAGPLISLLQGVSFLCFFLLYQNIKEDGFSALFLLNMACFGFSTCFGYLMITPFSGAGDMGKIAQTLELSMITRLLIAFTGGILFTLLARKSGLYYFQLSPLENSVFRINLFFFALLPWLTSASLTLMINGIHQHPILLAYPFFLGFYIFIAIMDNPAPQILDSPDIQWQIPQAFMWMAALMPVSWMYAQLK